MTEEEQSTSTNYEAGGNNVFGSPAKLKRLTTNGGYKNETVLYCTLLGRH